MMIYSPPTHAVVNLGYRTMAAITATETPDERIPAPEEDILPVTETVEETMPDAEPDPEGLDDPDDDEEDDE